MARLATANTDRFESAANVIHSVIDGPFGRKHFRSSVKIDETEWCTVFGRMAMPWANDHETTGTFTIAVEYVPQPEYLPDIARAHQWIGKV